MESVTSMVLLPGCRITIEADGSACSLPLEVQ